MMAEMTRVDDSCDPPTAVLQSLSRQVFDVYCDQLVLNALKQNDELKEQNAKMEPVRNMLIHLTIYHGENELLKINLQQQQQFDNNTSNNTDATSHRIYHVNHENEARIQFPYEDTPMLHCKLSSVGLAGGPGDVLSRLYGSHRPKLEVLNHSDATTTVQLEFPVSIDVTITGTLTNFAGTVREIQAMIDSNRFLTHYSTMGFVDATTGRSVARDIDNSLDGAVFSLETVRIVRSLIHPIVLLVNNDGGDCLLDDSLSEVKEDELQVFARVNKKHAVLCKAAINQKALKNRNLLLKASRQLLQTVTARLGDLTIQFLIEHGSFGNMAHDEDQVAWVMEPACGGGGARHDLILPTSGDVSMLQLEMAGIPWSRPGGSAVVPRRFTAPNGDLILRYAPDVEAVYCINDITPADTIQNGVPLQPETAMQLVRIQVNLTTIQRQLEALGIEAND